MHVVAEIRYWHEKHGVMDFAFYDDALLADVQNHAAPLFEEISACSCCTNFVRWN